MSRRFLRRCGIANIIFFLSVVAIAFGLTDSIAQTGRATPEAATEEADRQILTLRRHAIVAAHPLAARAGREILRAGGNAIDAAIATQMVLNVVEPQSSGIGGGGFLLYWDAAEKKLYSYDGRETAPLKATQNRFLKDDGTPMRWPDAVGTGYAIGTPGLIAMLEQAHQAHGKLPWEQLFIRAFTIAEQGFGVSPRLSSLLAQMGADKFSREARELFFDEQGEARPLGYV
ncbi:MAG: gamma-glutamyltransferase, partial [Fimbriimonadaceae bacterium]|nr:gamma-glutamyltransferase [Alphaproteobacteria bacterium]